MIGKGKLKDLFIVYSCIFLVYIFALSLFFSGLVCVLVSVSFIFLSFFAYENERKCGREETRQMSQEDTACDISFDVHYVYFRSS